MGSFGFVLPAVGDLAAWASGLPGARARRRERRSGLSLSDR